MWTHICLLVGLLLGLAHAGNALTCYRGNHTTVTAVFPRELANCTTKNSTQMCVEKRRKNWEADPGFFELYFGCGNCGSFDQSKVDCRECSTDLCNTEYGEAFKPSVAKLKLCYASMDTKVGALPLPVFCAQDENCTASTNPNDPDHVLTGCQPHCSKLQWKDCRFCGYDLCNLQPGFNNVSLAGGAVGPAPTPPAILMEKVTIPEPPPAEKMEVAAAAAPKATRSAESDKSSSTAAKASAASSGELAAQPVAMATLLLAAASWACLVGAR